MTRKHLQDLLDIYRDAQAIHGQNHETAIQAGATYHAALTKYTKIRGRVNANRIAKDQVYKDLGMTKVRGALGGTYYE